MEPEKEGEQKTISISSEGKINTPTETPKITETITTPTSTIPSRVIRTFESDIATAMKEKKGSVIKIAIAEQTKKSSEKEIEGKVSKRNYIFLGLTLISILGGLGFIGFVVWQKIGNEIAPIEAVVAPLIAAEKQKEIEITGLSESKIIAKIDEEMGNRTLRLDTIENIYLTETIGETKEAMAKEPITTEKLFSIIGARIPSVLLRSLGPKFMLGVHVFNGNSSFLILKTDFYENAFLGLLKWENEMPEDLLPPLGVKLTNENRYLLDVGFRDITIKNIDSRAILDQSGKAILIYSIPNKDTIVITTGEDTLSEVVNRLNAPQPTIK
ncbi:MAG: hypothetical protein A2648_00020 [Candidatus Lloydbacteria bacterium RIFCSPHIGHO2_01_FULL_41_20]|uniref:DUF4340 domain-containing protein n=1 Tax=Candidatus Lloydbacteria bacterium RIFCSPHIGHO2_01_FULL_41_20 TaxID=1798657 RepID=A0A1G2CU55_9BACT|nr:MAG: hypothetical protein A2648_00020 [Candidatus Lloydbacteria bacterium RIFCSPHIGHO2_01_FULL_41_20]